MYQGHAALHIEYFDHKTMKTMPKNSNSNTKNSNNKDANESTPPYVL